MSKGSIDVSTVSSRSIASSARAQRLNSTALISSGGHTFVVERRILIHDDEPPIETYFVTTPPNEGELIVLRLGRENDGPFGVEHYSPGDWPISTERALWWVHALHATTRFAEHLNKLDTRKRPACA